MIGIIEKGKRKLKIRRTIRLRQDYGSLLFGCEDVILGGGTASAVRLGGKVITDFDGKGARR
jgi:hypothetical protein